jgi:hypothetical protein
MKKRGTAAVVLASMLVSATAAAAEMEPTVASDTIITGRGFGHGRHRGHHRRRPGRCRQQPEGPRPAATALELDRLSA